MRLHEYNETEVFNEALDYIGKHCNSFLKEAMAGGKFMWSGRRNVDNWFIGQVRKDRKPVDSSQRVHKLMDDLFLRKFGFRARSNAVFCTGSTSTTSYYGNTYSIWPVGDYRFVYSPDVRDIAVELENIEDLYNQEHGGFSLKLPKTKEKERDKRVDGWVKDLMSSYTDKNIKNAIRSGNEIMVNCDKYVALNHSLSLKLLGILENRKRLK